MRRVAHSSRARTRAASTRPTAARALLEKADEGFQEWLRSFALSLVMNEPIRPAHVPVPVVAGAMRMYLLRAVLLGAIGATCFSMFFAPNAVSELSAAGVNVANPIMGVATAFDLLWYGLVHITDLQGSMIWRIGTATWVASIGAFSAFLCFGLLAFRGMLYQIPRHLRGMERNNEWATLADLKRARLIGHNEPGVLCGSVDVPPILGFIKVRPEMLVYPGPQHIELAASSGSGKDVVLACTDGYWPYSMITSDAKLEQYQLGGGRARFHDEKDVYVFNPGAAGRGEEYVDSRGRKHLELFGSNSWNLLDEIPWGTPDESVWLRTASAQVVAKSEKDFEGDNAHWARLAQSMFMVGAYKVELDPLETRKSVTRVAQLIALGDGIPGQTKLTRPSEAGDSLTHETLETLIGFSVSSRQFGAMPSWAKRVENEITTRMQLEIDEKRLGIGTNMSEADFEVFVRAQRREAQERIDRFRGALRHPDLETLLGQLLKIRGDEAGSAYSSFNQCMAPWLSETIERNTMSSDFSILSLINGERPAHLYLGNQVATRAAVLRIHQIFLSMFLTKVLPNMAMDQTTKTIASPWKYPCILRFNELDALGEVPGLVTAVPLLRSYRIYYFGAYQTRAQLEKTYGEAERKIITNQCDVQMFHTPGDDSEAKELSEGCGERQTVRAEDSESGSGTSRSYRSGTVALIDPTQASMIPKLPEFEWDKDYEKKTGQRRVKRTKRAAYQIIRVKGCPPVYARKEQWFNENFRWLADQYKRFGLPPLLRSQATLSDLKRQSALASGEQGVAEQREDRSAPARVRTEDVARVELRPVEFDRRNVRVTRRARRTVRLAGDGVFVDE